MNRSRRSRRLAALVTTLVAVALVTSISIELSERSPTPSTENAVATASGDSSPHRSGAASGAEATASQAEVADALTTSALATPAPIPGRRLRFRDAQPRSGDLATIARAVLDENHERLGLGGMPGTLRLKREFESLSGWHLRYEQVVGDAVVYGSEVSVHVAPDGRPLLANSDVFAVDGVATEPQTPADAATRTAQEFVDEDAPDSVMVKAARLAIRPEAKSGALCWIVDARSDEDSLRVFVDAIDGGVLAVDNMRIAAEGTARVFDPNPAYTLRAESLIDDKDRDNSAFRSARTLVTLRRLDGTGFLRGTWADVTNTSSPSFSETLDWTEFGRDDREFEQVMAYYHIDTLQDLLQQLGVTNANAETQRVDAHGTPKDNSFYDPISDEISFGDGGVDDAEDADIVRHEYGHAIQFDQVEDWGQTGQGNAMGEGFGDYLAAALHPGGAPAWDPLVGSWDTSGISRFSPPYLRRVDKNKRFPANYDGSPHSSGEIWSRLLWDINGLIGRDEALRIIIEAHFLLTPRADFEDGAAAILAANAAIRDSADDAAIRGFVADRGISVGAPPVELPPEDSFEENDSSEAAASIDAGEFANLLLADEDWYRLRIPAGSQFQVMVDFDHEVGDVDLEARTVDGKVWRASLSTGPLEEFTVAAGAQDTDVLLRVFPAFAHTPHMAYRLTITAADLKVLPARRTRLFRLLEGTTEVLRFDVAARHVDRGHVIRARARAAGRRGALPEIRVVDPQGMPVHSFGDGTSKRAVRAAVAAEQAGSWLIEVRPRDGATGPVRVRAVFRRR